MPSASAGQVPAAGPVSSAPAVITRLVTAGLVLVAAAVVLTTMGPGRNVVPRAQVAADTPTAVLVPDGTPAFASLRGVQRIGDAIVLRVDPSGDAAARPLVVSPGAT